MFTSPTQRWIRHCILSSKSLMLNTTKQHRNTQKITQKVLPWGFTTTNPSTKPPITTTTRAFSLRMQHRPLQCRNNINNTNIPMTTTKHPFSKQPHNNTARSFKPTKTQRNKDIDPLNKPNDVNGANNIPFSFNDKSSALNQSTRDLEFLAKELRIDPKTGKLMTLKPRKPILLRLVQIMMFSFGLTATTIIAFVFQHKIITTYFNLLFKYRLWRDDFDHVMEYASEEYSDKVIPVSYVENDDIDGNIYNLQRIWYHRTFVMNKLTSRISKQLEHIANGFNNYYDILNNERMAIMQHVNDPSYRDDIMILQLLSDDFQAILDSAQLTKNELGEFNVALAKANSGFAINSKKTMFSAKTKGGKDEDDDDEEEDQKFLNQKDQGKLLFFQSLDKSVNESSLYIDRLQDLLTTSIQQTQRFKEMGKFLTDREGYLEYRQQILEADQQQRQKYDELMSLVENELVANNNVKTSNDPNGVIDLSQPEKLKKQIEEQALKDKNLMLKAQEEAERIKKLNYSLPSNQSKAPPAMHLDLDAIEKQRLDAQKQQQEQQKKKDQQQRKD